MLVDRELAGHWLRAVGYYRLSGYWHPFRLRFADDHSVSSCFAPGTSFRHIAQLYEFDRKLKSHLMSALERVEIAFRSRIADTLGQHSVMALSEPELFRCPEQHSDMLEVIDGRMQRALDSKDPVAAHHRDKYNSEFPVWAAVEFLDFGDISRLYENLQEDDRAEIAQWFGWVPPARHPEARMTTDLKNWLHHLTIVRNTAAHHARLWNRVFEPTAAKRIRQLDGTRHLSGQQDRIYGTVVVLGQLVARASPGTTWAVQLRRLIMAEFDSIPGVALEQMGFPPNWEEFAPFAD